MGFQLHVTVRRDAGAAPLKFVESCEEAERRCDRQRIEKLNDAEATFCKLKKWVKADDHSKGQTNRRFKAAKSANGQRLVRDE